MGLKRYSIGIQYYGHWPEIDEEHDQERGDWVRWDDVDALLARIRAAVEAERSEVEYVFGNWSVPDQKDTLGRWWDAQSALDALLAEGGV